MLFFWLNNIALAKERVKTRVQEGGHHIPEKIIERRYIRGIRGIHHLFDTYLNLVDGALIFDNSYGKHELIAQKFGEEEIVINNPKKYQQLKGFYNDKNRATNRAKG